MYVKINLASFEINSNFHLYDTRNRDALCFPVHDLSTFERSPVYMGIKIYNNLPIFIRAISSVSGFKKQLLAFLQNNVFYDLSKFFDFVYTNY